MKVGGRALAGAIAWTAAAKWSSQLVSWAALLVTARVLSPDDFGLIGMTVVFTGLITTLAESGLGTAVITLRDLTARQIRQMNCAAVLLGVSAAMATWLLARPVSWFYNSPPVATILSVSALGFIITGFRSIPGALLERDLKFKSLARIEAAQATLHALTTMALAFSGLGYWALVLGPISGNLLAATIFFRLHPCGFSWPDRDVRKALKLGSTVLLARVAWYGYSSADFLIAGRVFGPAVLGYYSLAWNFANLPTEKVSALVLRVTGSFFSALQHDLLELKRYLLLLTGALALGLFPVAVGMGLTAPEIIEVAFGKRWLPATLPLQLLAVYGVMRSILTLLPPVLTVTGSAMVTTWTNLVCLLVLPTCFWFAAQQSVNAIAVVWVVVYPFCALPMYVFAARNLKMSGPEYFAELWPALSGCAVMGAGVYGLRQALPADWPAIARLVSLTFAGAALYGATLVLFHRSVVIAHIEKLQRLRQRA